MRNIRRLLAEVLLYFWLAGAAAAEVALTPRVKQDGLLPGPESISENFVLFGRFLHKIGADGETDDPLGASPILWRIASTDQDAAPSQATLLSHRILSKRGYQEFGTRGDGKDLNTWEGSQLQIWLNSSASGGFLENFASEELTGPMLDYPDGTSGSPVSLPSGGQRYNGSSWIRIDETGELWFGGAADFDIARRSGFKDSDLSSYLYWLRSPIAAKDETPPYDVWSIGSDGAPLNYGAYAGNGGVRPVCLLDLQPFALKSASDSTSAMADGSLENPYLLYLDSVDSADFPPVSATALADRITLAFAQHVFHAYQASKDETPAGLAGNFSTDPPHAPLSAAVWSGDVILTLANSLDPDGIAPAIIYDPTANRNDGIGFVSGDTALPTRVATFRIAATDVAVMPWLSSLTPSSGVLSPPFAPEIMEYKIAVGNSVSNMALTPVAASSSTTIRVGAKAVSSGTSSDSFSLGVGDNLLKIELALNGKTTVYTVVATRAAPIVVPAPGDDGNSGMPTPLETSLNDLNEKFPSDILSVSVPPDTPTSALAAIGQKEGIAATSIKTTTGASFTPATKPALIPGERDFLAVPQSFSVSLPVGGSSGTVGNVLVLRLAIEVDKLPGFETWKTLTSDLKTVLLEDLNVVLNYEYPDKWAIMVGKNGVLSWPAAAAAGIASFTDTGIVFGYAAFDSDSSVPYAAGNLMAIPDGKRDGKIVDPVWLIMERVVPTSVALTPPGLYLKKGENKSVTATFLPAHANDTELLWTVGDPSVVSVVKTASADTWSVRGLTEGVTVLTAAVSADRNVEASMTATVQPAEAELIESLSVSPRPPYRTGETIEVTAALKRASSSVKMAITRPDGQIEAKDAALADRTAKLAYTPESLGTYRIAATATDAANGRSYAKATTLTVTSGEDSSSSGGCRTFAFGPIAAIGLSGILLFLPRRRKSAEGKPPR